MANVTTKVPFKDFASRDKKHSKRRDFTKVLDTKINLERKNKNFGKRNLFFKE